MCGIAGELHGPGEKSQHIALQLRTLRHRGPDAEGAFECGRAWVGQTRLAIIDLKTGDPPITTEDGAIGVVLNGEIYNYRELREELRRRGHTFSTECDTEVIAHLAEDLEPVALAKSLDGMFAFAAWDDRRGRLILGRDRLGKKPLFYWTDGHGRLVFGSEIKSLFANPRVPRRLRPEAISPYLAFGYVPTPDTFFERVRSVPPGHVLSAQPGGEPRVERYWSPPLAGVDGTTHLQLSPTDAAREVRRLLEAAVRRRLMSDVPRGAFLSGGIDSSTVVGLMARELDGPVQTFTIGFEDRDGFDERRFARLVAQRHHTDHHEFVVQPHAVDLVERLVWHNDQPFGDSSVLPTFLLSEVTRCHVTVALSGDGGDELFAGYPRFAAGLVAQQYERMPKPLQRAVAGGLELLPSDKLRGRVGSVQRFARAAERGLLSAYMSWITCLGDRDREALLNGSYSGSAADTYSDIWVSSSGAKPLDRLLDLNLRTYLVDELLVKADRMSMAHGLEVRSPFLDRTLLAFATRLPTRMKVRGLSLKRVLRSAVGDLLPREILSRPKRGFGIPLDRWFREDLRSYLESTVGSSDACVRQYLTSEPLDRLLAEHQSCARNHGHALWTLLTLEVFLRRFEV